jgi:hypothetical protein
MFLASHFYLIDFFLVAPSFRAGFFSEENKGLQSLNFYSITMLINLAFFCLSKRKQERKGHPAELTAQHQDRLKIRNSFPDVHRGTQTVEFFTPFPDVSFTRQFRKGNNF